MKRTQSINKKISKLPPAAIEELEKFIDSLLDNAIPEEGRKLKQDWAGGLKEWKSQFTSLGLQKKALEWRSK